MTGLILRVARRAVVYMLLAPSDLSTWLYACKNRHPRFNGDYIADPSQDAPQTYS